MKSNVAEDICYAQPTTFAQRVAIANDFVSRFHYPVPVAIDAMNDAADHLYGGWPERIYIIDETGKIVYRGGLGPFNYHPEEARAWLAQRFGPTQHASSKHVDFLFSAKKLALAAKPTSQRR
jgi:hypothetical protein